MYIYIHTHLFGLYVYLALLRQPPHLHCFCLPYIVHDDGEEEINLLID